MFGLTELFKKDNPLLDSEVSYYQFLIGANDPVRMKHYEETIEPGSFTLRELLQININPRMLFETLLREKVLPDSLLHKMSYKFCLDFLNQLENEGIPNNPKLHELLEVKNNWLKDKVNMYQLESAQREAHFIFSELSDGNSTYKDAASFAVYSATLSNSYESIRGVMKATSKIFDTKSEYKHWQKILFEELSK